RRVQDMTAAWRQRPAMKRRSFAELLAFLESELRLDLIQMSALGTPPDWSRIEGRLGTWGNPAMRWRGDKRLLPSSLFWIVSRAIMMAETQGQAPTTLGIMPDLAAVVEREEPRSAIAEDVAHIHSQIKSF
ncbi:MAG: hypothetical protein NZM07_06045, partial [Elioraea sp.]|nr:hypothetical protein [Elioraea sp.]